MWILGALAVLLGGVVVAVALGFRVRATPRACPACRATDVERVYEQPAGIDFDPREPPKEPWGFARCRSCGAHIVMAFQRADEAVDPDRWRASLDHARRTAYLDP